MVHKTLITGATGLIGKELTSLLIKSEKQIFTLGRREARNGLPDENWIECDLSAQWSADKLPKQIDAVIHLAQSEYFRDFPASAEEIFEVNVMSALRLLEYARNADAKKIVLASSGGIYGFSNQPFKEDSPVPAKGDIGFYLDTKLCSEVIADNYTSFMDVIILRPFFVYGPGQRHDMLIPRIVSSVKRGKPIILQGQDGIKINPAYVTDAARAVLKTLDLKGSQTINIGGEEVLSLRAIAEMVGEILGEKPVFEIHDDEVPHNIIGDISEMSEKLGCTEVGFEEGIKKYIAETDL